MKKIFYLLIMAMPIAALTGCSDSDDDPRPIEIISADIQFGPDGGSEAIELKGGTSGILAESKNTDWLTVDVGSEKVTVTATNHYTKGNRTGTITLSSGNITKDIKIKQQGIEISITNYEETKVYDIDKNISDTFEIVVNAENIAMSVDKDNNSGWLTVSLDGNTAKIEAAATPTPRTGNVTITVGEYDYPIEVSQTKASYEYYLGNFVLSYTNDSLENIDADVTLQKKTDGESYTLICSRFLYDIEVNYNTETGGIFLKPQKMDTEVVSGHFIMEDGNYEIWLALWGSETSYTTPTISDQARILGEPELDAGEYVIKFHDGGGWDEGALDCFCISYFSEGDLLYSFDKYSPDFEATYFDLSMKKK